MIFLGAPPPFEMPNQRKDGKKKIGVWVTDEEQAQLKAELKKHGMKNVAELLRAIREGTVKVSLQIKALAFAAIGTGAGGGCLVWIVAPIVAVACWLV